MINSFGLDIVAVSEGENVKTGIEAIQKHKPDLVFLDIQMPDGTGFDVLNAFTEKKFAVIFITAHEEFAIKAIKFSALDYILKPVDPEELRSAVEFAIASIGDKSDPAQFEALTQNITPTQKRKLVLKTTESVFVVELEEIIRCESDRNYTVVFLTEKRKILISKTLKDYEDLLGAYNFMRIHQSHLVNLDFVDRYDKTDGGSVVMKDGSQVPLSPQKKDMFFKVLESL